MRGKDSKSREITDIIGDVVRNVSGEECMISVPDIEGLLTRVPCPRVNYVFGNARYVSERIEELGKTDSGSAFKYPLIALFVPVVEHRGDSKFFAKVKVQILIAISSLDDWSNEQRSEVSFRNILRPIYRRFMECLKGDPRIETGYSRELPHEYSENYSYGRYGAYTPSGDKLSDPIDAINITNLELTIKNLKCI